MYAKLSVGCPALLVAIEQRGSQAEMVSLSLSLPPSTGMESLCRHMKKHVRFSSAVVFQVCFLVYCNASVWEYGDDFVVGWSVQPVCLNLVGVWKPLNILTLKLDQCQKHPKTQKKKRQCRQMHASQQVLRVSLKLSRHVSARTVGSNTGKMGEGPEKAGRRRDGENKRGAEGGSPSYCQQGAAMVLARNKECF